MKQKSSFYTYLGKAPLLHTKKQLMAVSKKRQIVYKRQKTKVEISGDADEVHRLVWFDLSFTWAIRIIIVGVVVYSFLKVGPFGIAWKAMKALLHS